MLNLEQSNTFTGYGTIHFDDLENTYQWSHTWLRLCFYLFLHYNVKETWFVLFVKMFHRSFKYYECIFNVLKSNFTTYNIDITAVSHRIKRNVPSRKFDLGRIFYIYYLHDYEGRDYLA